MTLNFKKKQQIISGVRDVIEFAVSAVVASLEGITVNEITGLRDMCRKSGVYVYVVRNTLMRRALIGSVFEGLQNLFFGSNVIAFSSVEIRDCAKIFVQFSKSNPKFKIKGAMFGGILFEESNIVSLSSLPTYKESILNLLYAIKNISIGRLHVALRILSTFKENRIGG
ncbi:50S ribosomal protein L10 [Blochmannia endosymbiont of Polyrhachis (Hedomyrma) turneri]|uniref:50S ribosomal protein L10 n=1 Tax=Blochmannia endosymbiont of Polyrhachis (Hedomyrma) turneri TaxID=1505596 RepID=UPI00061A7747|nr:50S ribosomal protein L10 [Blochmannia endosymbiont of Polyrhachis (Hedomyrma) turneri]AKC60117.1 50S ribosomal protein L10 [Blochmannia endosymbiont of Polyrhachis (Hedomyrma) turneri]